MTPNELEEMKERKDIWLDLALLEGAKIRLIEKIIKLNPSSALKTIHKCEGVIIGDEQNGKIF